MLVCKEMQTKLHICTFTDWLLLPGCCTTTSTVVEWCLNGNSDAINCKFISVISSVNLWYLSLIRGAVFGKAVVQRRTLNGYWRASKAAMTSHVSCSSVGT
jgi:hypothetical protein